MRWLMKLFPLFLLTATLHKNGLPLSNPIIFLRTVFHFPYFYLNFMKRIFCNSCTAGNWKINFTKKDQLRSLGTTPGKNNMCLQAYKRSCCASVFFSLNQVYLEIVSYNFLTPDRNAFDFRPKCPAHMPSIFSASW